ncbi:MAG TPA: DciA family protein [Burkholderiales bacterium]|nr:DciA family protein [Burkholderiales bacterium]
MSEKRFGALIREHPDLNPLREQLEQHARLQADLAAILPANLTASAAIIKDGELILQTDNGAVASKLRQIAPRVLAKLRQRGYEVTGMRLQVQARNRDNSLPQKQISLNQAGRTAVEAIAARLPASSLKTALQRLARR